MKWKKCYFYLFIYIYSLTLLIFFLKKKNIIDGCTMHSHVQVFFFGWMKKNCWNNSINLKYEIFLKKKKRKEEETNSSIFYLSNFLASWGNSWGGRIFILCSTDIVNRKGAKIQNYFARRSCWQTQAIDLLPR